MAHSHACPARDQPRLIPYGRQWIDEDDVAAVVEVLRSDWLTTGPAVERFEKAVAAFTGAREAVALSSGTAGLHAAMHALGIGPGDEVIVPAMTFAATANCVVYQGGTPVFADVDPETLLISPDSVRRRITPREAARLQGLPDSFKLHPDAKVAYKQLGNAVNVGVARYATQRLLGDAIIKSVAS